MELPLQVFMAAKEALGVDGLLVSWSCSVRVKAVFYTKIISLLTNKPVNKPGIQRSFFTFATRSILLINTALVQIRQLNACICCLNIRRPSNYAALPTNLSPNHLSKIDQLRSHRIVARKCLLQGVGRFTSMRIL